MQLETLWNLVPKAYIHIYCEERDQFLLNEDMRDFYFDNLRYCRHCDPRHGDGKAYQILNKEYYICAEPELYFHNPNLDQINMIKKFVEIRLNNIRSYK
jgi:hypothetical protein